MAGAFPTRPNVSTYPLGRFLWLDKNTTSFEKCQSNVLDLLREEFHFLYFIDTIVL